MDSNKTSGKFIVLDGIDGCGKGTQVKLLSDFLSQKGYIVVNKKYPEYGQPIGDLIHEFLYKKFDLDLGAELLLYTADHLKDKKYIEKCVLNNKIFLADRYFTSTIVYQQIKGYPLEKILKLAELIELSKPDLSILIKISADSSLNRKSQQKPGNLDRHEENRNFQSLLAKTFEEVASKNIFCDWAIVDGEQPPEKVFEEIKKVLYNKFGI